MNGNESELRRLAERLASRPYEVRFEVDQLSDGSNSFMAYNPELPGCQSDGKTREEAEKNLEDARFVYIYYLLVDRLDVPSPCRVVYSNLDEQVNSGYTSLPIHFSSEKIYRKKVRRSVMEQAIERTAPY